jgi:hypothetical protein
MESENQIAEAITDPVSPPTEIAESIKSEKLV